MGTGEGGCVGLDQKWTRVAQGSCFQQPCHCFAPWGFHPCIVQNPIPFKIAAKALEGGLNFVRLHNFTQILTDLRRSHPKLSVLLKSKHSFKLCSSHTSGWTGTSLRLTDLLYFHRRRSQRSLQSQLCQVLPILIRSLRCLRLIS